MKINKAMEFIGYYIPKPLEAWGYKDIKKCLKVLKSYTFSTQEQSEVISFILWNLGLEYNRALTENGLYYYEVHNMYFIMETEKRFKIIKIYQ